MGKKDQEAMAKKISDAEKAQKKIISQPNVWILDTSIKDRIDLHNSETVIIDADLNITIKREPDSGIDFEMPTFAPGETPDYKDGIIPYAGS